MTLHTAHILSAWQYIRKQTSVSVSVCVRSEPPLLCISTHLHPRRTSSTTTITESALGGYAPASAAKRRRDIRRLAGIGLNQPSQAKPSQAKPSNRNRNRNSPQPCFVRISRRNSYTGRTSRGSHHTKINMSGLTRFAASRVGLVHDLVGTVLCTYIAYHQGCVSTYLLKYILQKINLAA